jgi:hypothetical protein
MILGRRRFQFNIAGRHYGRDSVFIHHLADIVFEQHNELIEGLYLALQFDSIYQKYRDRDSLSAQRVKERVL